MKNIAISLVLLVALSAFGGGVTVHLDTASAGRYRTNLVFECNITLDNQTGAALVAEEYPVRRLALTITDSDGHTLATKKYPWPMKFWSAYSANQTFQLHPGKESFQLSYASFEGVGFSLPPGTKKVKLQIAGTLSGSSFTNRLTSNVVETDVP